MNNFVQSHGWDKLKAVFLPIKPVYAERLMDGSKRFEFRRRPIGPDVTHIVVYASSPYKRILGIVKVSSVESGSVHSVWNKTKDSAGISKADYLEYFSGTDTAYAIAIDPSETVRFERHISPSEIEHNFVVPQSFKYVNTDFVAALMVCTPVR
jgi:predicted transcriptional regulator